MTDGFNADAASGPISADAWVQISSHLPQTPARQAREAKITAARQQRVERLLATGPPTRRLRHIRTLSAPFDGARLAQFGAEHDGTLGVWWSDADGDRDLYTVESETERVAQVTISSFPGAVDHVVGLPGRRWLGSVARVDWTDEGNVPDTAWIIDDAGRVTAAGCLGDAHLRPVVTRDGRIFVTYFDEHPWRASDGAWKPDADGAWTLIPGSVLPLESVQEYSDHGRYTAGYTGMTIFDDRLHVVARHTSPTDVLEVYASHTDGARFWYVSYPEWYIDTWGPDGQENRLSSKDFKGAPLLASGEHMARFGGPGAHRDTLYTVFPDGRIGREIVTFPDGTALRRGRVTTWGSQLHYVDGHAWSALDVF